MKVREIIGRTITDILVWSKIEVNGLDEAQVVLRLDNHKIVGIPWDFKSEQIEREVREGSVSLFSSKKDSKSIFARLTMTIGLTEFVSLKQSKLRNLKNQKIIDFWMFVDSDSVGFLQLANGWIITETTMAPHGTGMVGLNYYESQERFEAQCGIGYKRLTDETG